MPSIFTLKYEITHKDFLSGRKIKHKNEGTEVLQMEKFSDFFATEQSEDPLNIANLVSNYFNNCQKVFETKDKRFGSTNNRINYPEKNKIWKHLTKHY